MSAAADFWTAATSGGVDALALWSMLAPAERRTVRFAAKRALAHRVDVLRALGARVTELLVSIDWPTSRPPLSDHLRLEIAAAHRRGRSLDAGEPVPGCPCTACTRVDEDDPARVAAWKRTARPAVEQDRRREWERKVHRARTTSILTVASSLGLGPVEGRGYEVRVCCPFHADEDPSLHINKKKDVWFCFVCDEGGDAIGLLMKARRMTFVEAVEELS